MSLARSVLAALLFLTPLTAVADTLPQPESACKTSGRRGSLLPL